MAILIAVTVEGGRATPFELDATGSYDPGNPGAVLSFGWEIDDPVLDAEVGEAELDDFDDVPGGAGRIFQTFPKTFVAGSNGEGVVVRQVRVRVSSANGASSIAEATVVVRNQRPIVDPGEDLFLSTGRTEPVVLDARGGGRDATSIDPDADPLFFTWTQLTGDPVVLDTSMDPVYRQRVRFVPPLSRRSLTFRVDGTDGMSQESGFLRVHRAMQVWIASRSPTRLHRVFPDFVSKTALEDMSAPGVPVEFAAMTVVAVTSSGYLWTAENSGPDTLVRRLDPELRQVATFTVPAWTVPVWGDVEGEDLCLTVQIATSTNRAFVRVNSTGALAPVAVTDGGRMHATGTGDCWAVSGNAVYRMDAAGALTVVASGFASLRRSTVDADGNLWAAEVDDSTGAALRIVRVSGNGLFENLHLFDPTPPGTQAVTVTELAPRRGGGIWVHDSNRVLRTLSSTGVLAVTDAPRMRLDPGRARRQFVSDLADGTIWLADSQSGDLVHLFDAGDTVRELGRTAIETLAPSAPLFLTPFLAPDGSVFASATGGDSWLFRIPTHMNSNERVNVDLLATVVGGLAVDRGRGAAWILDGATFEQRALRTTHTGRVLAHVPRQATDVVATADGNAWLAIFDPLPSSSSSIVYVSSTGGTLAIVEPDASNTVFALDAAGEQGCAVEVVDSNFGPFESDTRGVRFSRSSLVPEVLRVESAGVAGINGCWVDRVDGATWLVTLGPGCFTGGTPSATLERFEPGATTPSLSLTQAAGIDFACKFFGDELGGIWMEQFGQVARIGATGPTGETLSGGGLVIPCGNGDPACREVWTSTSAAVIRASATGLELGRFTVPTSGPITGFDVVP